ncbi:MAG: hypothetical protein IPM96_05655 [Ignavibacteria bacterium]|nr:hypothetical protein [Ignavibacteria bacterium]
MKIFLPSDGLFELKFPIDWTYNLSKGYIHQFTFNKGISSFQISVLSEAAKKSFNKIKINPNFIKHDLGKTYVFELLLENGHEFNTTVWYLEKDRTIFLASHTYPLECKYHEKYIFERETILEIMNSLNIIKPEERVLRIAWYKFTNFLDGIGASEEMFINAEKNGCFIECVCLLANQIDGMLRVSNILFDQILNKSLDMNVALIYQGEKDKRISEKEIYKLSETKGIIDKALLEELYLVYDERNKVVHRYIISEITTRDILEIAYKYSIIRNKIRQVVYDLESKQIELGLGMTITKEMLTKEKIQETYDKFNATVFEKLGRIDLNNKPSD